MILNIEQAERDPKLRRCGKHQGHGKPHFWEGHGWGDKSGSLWRCEPTREDLLDYIEWQADALHTVVQAAELRVAQQSAALRAAYKRIEEVERQRDEIQHREIAAAQAEFNAERDRRIAAEAEAEAKLTEQLKAIRKALRVKRKG